MGYSSRRGRRPDEAASKAAHAHVINDAMVQQFLSECEYPRSPVPVQFDSDQKFLMQAVVPNPMRHVIAIDGGYTAVSVREEFPSVALCFFQFGALIFDIDDLEQLDAQPFIDPDDIARLKNIQRLKLVLPIRNLSFRGEARLTNAVRRALHEFFVQAQDGERLLDTLRWLIYEEWGNPKSEYSLSYCPHCHAPQVALRRSEMSANGCFSCPQCQGELFLSDVFRFHEAVDDELGAGGILGYVTTSIEQIILAHLVRLILATKPALLREFLFIKDGPLAFFGQTANLHRSMRALSKFLFEEHDFFCAGLEKSGPFVEHADEIAPKMQPGEVLLLTTDYIYRYIMPGRADPSRGYADTSYWGNKLIFKAASGGMYVVTMPTIANLPAPAAADFRNLHAVLTNIQKLKCDMYDSALIPVALANKLVSLANHPSSRILQKFAIGAVSTAP